MTDVVRVTRTLAAAPQEVYDAWTNADRLQEWLCPGEGIVAEAYCDPQVGGQYRIVKILAHGADRVTGEYLVVEPPHRLVFTWTADTTGGRRTQVTVTLGAAGGGDVTEMTITHEQLPDQNTHDGAQRAWVDIAGKLERYLAGVR
jgi:uncharacterized protein YndB with AHSA1/START domain